jgi:NitT/TauT family transport system permease protein
MLITIGIIVLPFLFFLIFSKFAKLTTSTLFFNIFISLMRLFVAYIIAAFLGWIFAVSFYRGRRATIALPIFDVLQSFPTFAILPMAILFWGPSEFTVIFFLVITIIWPIFFTVISSLKLTKHEWEEAVEVYQLRGWKFVKYYLVPASIPGFITGSIIGMGEAWEALVATEIIVGIKTGLGDFFQNNVHSIEITSFGILGLLILIFTVNKLLWLPLLDYSHKQNEE